MIMASAEQHQQQDYSELSVEVSSFYERLQYARSVADMPGELENERKMNSSLEELGDVIRALGHVSL